jgi:flagellar L-ring protein precursor FlgH
MNRWLLTSALLLLSSIPAWPQKSSPLDRYIDEAEKGAASAPAPPGGSLYVISGPLADLARDPRARLMNDIVTILVVEQATAAATGSTTSARKSSVKAGISSIYGATPTRLQNLANTSNASSLDGSGTTKRESTVTTRLSARVTRVLPNGYLVVEANKDVIVNSERQLVTVRGVVRPADLARDNTVRSDRLAEMEIRINGKGVVNDAIKRPFFLYRLLLGLLPF